MRTSTLFTALAGLTLAGALALTGCSGSTDAEPDTGGQGAEGASSFLACLTSGGVEAKINDQGMVLVRYGEESTDGSMSTSAGSGEAEALLIEGDESGNTWVAPANADYFTDAPDIQDAYAACEEQHPDFSQPPFDLSDDAAHQEAIAEQEEAALAFAQCARENGFSQIADPDFSVLSGVLIPDDFTEADFRSLVEACWEPDSNVSFGSSDSLGFEPWAILEEIQNAPAS